MQLQVKMYPNEHWWGGDVPNASIMPFDSETKTTVLLTENGRTTVQSAPFFLSDKGRYIWSEKGFVAKFEDGIIDCEGEQEIVLVEAGKTLRDAFVSAKKDKFPYATKVNSNKIFYQYPQFNSWVELIKEQTEEGIMRYAKGLVKNGYKRGILMIDDGWQKEHGTWMFDSDKFKNPKAMIKKLHKMGFKIMLWVSPYISLSSDRFLDLAREKGVETNTGHLVRLKDGRVAIYKWWNGYCAMFDFTKEGDRQHMKEQLDVLVNEYGVDGFKFDGGDYTWRPINEVDTFSTYGQLGGASETGSFKGGSDPMRYGWKLVDTQVTSTDDLNRAWVEFGIQYEYHEFKNAWKVGHLPMVSRLHDKAHKWGTGGLYDLIPHGIFIGLIGSPFICPDMVGGGSWTDFTEEALKKLDQELFVRMAECSALFPMVQYSAAPWRVLSKENAKKCFNMANLHEKYSNIIIKEVENSEITGEPILRNMEYNFPNQGYATIKDQFMIGDSLLVAPVIQKGLVARSVVLPEGKWQDLNNNVVYDGGQTVVVDAPLGVLPHFMKI